MKKFIFIILTFFAFACENDISTDNLNLKNTFQSVKLKSYEDSVNYSLGVVIGNQLKDYGVKEVDYDVLMQAVYDVLNNQPEDIPIHKDVAQNIVNYYIQKVMNQKTIEINDKNENFLTKNSNKNGVIVLESGLQYKILKEGTGKQPIISDNVTINFCGSLVDGTIFSNTYDKQPAKFVVRNAIKGWQEALLLMKEGAEWEIYLHPNLAFGSKGSKNVPPNSVVIYKIQLIKIN